MALQAKFNLGLALHQQGKLAEAERIYWEILQEQPDHFDALHLLGVIAVQTRRTEGGADLIRKAIGLNSEIAAAHSNLGNALRDLKRPRDALVSYNRAIALKPDHAEAYNNRGNALRDLKRPEDALASYDRAIVLKPEYAEAYYNRGNALLQDLKRPTAALANYDKALALKPDYAEAYNSRGGALQNLKRPEEALASYDRAIDLKLDYAEAHSNRGNVLRDLKRPDEALASYDKAIALKPDYAQVYYNRGVALRALKRPDDALASHDKAIALKPDYAEAYYNRGNALLQDLKRPEEALASYDQAIALKPDYAEAHNNRGIALTGKGDLAAAIESYTRVLQIKPDFAECYRNYSTITKIKPDDPFVPQMTKLASAGELSDTDLMHLSFALGKAEHDLGNKELCINHLIQGNAIRKKQLAYDISQDEKLFSSIKQFFYSDSRDWQVNFVSNSSIAPIFILGMPRSGTTLVEQIISSHSNVFGAGELEYLTQAVINSGWQLEKDIEKVFKTVGSFYNRKLAEVSDASVITDKMPLNFRWIGFILNALPNAKIVNLNRDPAAICWSNFKTYFPSQDMAFTFDRQDIAKYYWLYQDLMEFWHQQYPKKIYNLHYEEITENQEAETRKLFEYLELEWEENVLDFHTNERLVSTASNIQVRQKMYKGSSLEWKKYEQWLQPMLERLNA